MLFFAYYQSPVGFLRIESDGAFVQKIEFIDLVTEEMLRSQLPNLLTEQAIQQLEDYFNGKLRQFDFPVQANGTAFQEAVWKQLLEIPFGDTVSYLELSKRLGNEKAIRAVGTSNGKNKLAIVIPCHRVIGSDGSLTGYAGGLWRKKWLLDHESKLSGKKVATQMSIF